MNKNEIKEVLRELNIATGFRISLHDSSSVEICAAPSKIRGLCARVQECDKERELCERCDDVAYKRALLRGDTYSYKCRYGLTEIVSPIYNSGKHVGFLMMGQTFEGNEEKRCADERLALLNIEADERAALISDVPVVGKGLSASFSKILTICAKYLTLSGAVYGTEESIADAAMSYIKENFAKKIQIKDICASLGCSKTTLLSNFKSTYDTTVGAAITSVRLEAAKKQLSFAKDVSINDVALSVGFSDQSYFCKVFSQKYGVSPSECRRKADPIKERAHNSLPAPCFTHEK